MSYVKRKDRVFLSGKKNLFKKRSDCNLRSSSSCTDSRAWSSNREDVRQYMLDIVGANVTSSNVGKYIPSKVLIDILLKQKNPARKISTIKRKSPSAENLLSWKKSLKKQTSKEILITECEQYDEEEENLKEEEVRNLRELVKQLSDKVGEVDRLKRENLKLRVESGREARVMLDRALTENNSLAATVDKCKDAVDKNAMLQKNLFSIQKELKSLKHELTEKESVIGDLSTKLNDSTKKVKEEKQREVNVSDAIVSNKVLKVKLSTRNEKIKNMKLILEHQEEKINELVWQLQHAMNTFAWKEERLMEKVIGFKNMAESNAEKVVDLERKCELSEMFIRRLEVLRHEFRSANSALKDNVVFYRNQFKFVASKGLEMGARIQMLLKELAERDREIKRLSRYPSSTQTVVCFSQLKGCLSEEDVLDRDELGLRCVLMRMKRLVDRMSDDVWSSRGLKCPPVWAESTTQTQSELADACAQSERFVTDSAAQAQLPEDFIVKLVAAGVVIKAMTGVIHSLRETVSERVSQHDALEGDYIRCIEEKRLQESDIYELKEENQLLIQTISSLNQEIERNRSSAFQASNDKNNVLEIMCNLFEDNMTGNEEVYLDIGNILEIVINLFVQRLNVLEYINFDITQQRDHMAMRTGELEKSMLTLATALSYEMELSHGLENEVSSLCDELRLRELEIKKMELLLIKFDRLLSNPIRHHSKQCQTELKKVRHSSEESSQTDYMRHFCRRDNTSANSKIRRVWEKNKMKQYVKKFYRINLNIKKLDTFVKDLKTQLVVSTNSLKKLESVNSVLKENNNSFSLENSELKDKLKRANTISSELKRLLETEFSKNKILEQEKLKVSKLLKAVYIKLDCYRERFDKEFKDESVQSIETMETMLSDRKKQMNEIENLNNKIEHLMIMVKDLEANNLSKQEELGRCKIIMSNKQEEALRRTEILENEVKLKYESISNDLKNSYEKILQDLRREHSSEMESERNQYLNNLALMKETYERDIKQLKKTHADSLTKIQVIHVEEIEELKKENEEERLKGDDLALLIEKFKRDFENQKQSYEKQLKDKTEHLNHEKEVLREEMTRYLTEKDEQLNEITQKMDSNLKNIKRKCRVHMKKLQQENSEAVKELKKEFTIRLEDEIKKAESETIRKVICPAKEPSNQETSCKKCREGQEERKDLLAKIETLQKEIDQGYFSYNACDTEKRIWSERDKNKELNEQLSKDRDEKEKLKIRLTMEQRRVEKLEAIVSMLRNPTANENKGEGSEKYEAYMKPESESTEGVENEMLPDFMDELNPDCKWNSNLRMNFIQQCGLHHDFKKHMSYENFLSEEFDQAEDYVNGQ